MIISTPHHTKNKKGNVPRFSYFFSMVWGDRFIITPSEFLSEKWTLYSASVIPLLSLPVLAQFDLAEGDVFETKKEEAKVVRSVSIR